MLKVLKWKKSGKNRKPSNLKLPSWWAPDEGVQKGIVHWDKQNNDVPAPNCMLKVQEEIIKVEGL